MPPKPKFTRDEIVQAALTIVSEKGVEALTAKELGDALGASARPIFTVFASMKEAQLLFENMWIYTFGVGALCATRVCRFSEEKLGQMLSVEFQTMMLLAKSKAEDAS